MLYFNLSGGTFSTSSTVTAAREGVATTNAGASTTASTATVALALQQKGSDTITDPTVYTGPDQATPIQECGYTGRGEKICLDKGTGKNVIVDQSLERAHPVSGVMRSVKSPPWIWDQTFSKTLDVYTIFGSNRNIGPFHRCDESGKNCRDVIVRDHRSMSIEQKSIWEAKEYYERIAFACARGTACAVMAGQQPYGLVRGPVSNKLYGKYYDLNTQEWWLAEMKPEVNWYDWKNIKAAAVKAWDVVESACQKLVCPDPSKPVDAAVGTVLAMMQQTPDPTARTAAMVAMGFCSTVNPPQCQITPPSGGTDIVVEVTSTSRYPTGAYTRFHKAKLMWIVYGPAGSSLSGTNPLQTDPDNPGTVVLETTAAQPAGLPVRPPLDDPFYLKAWFWGAVGGAAVVAASTAVYVKKRRSRKA